MSTTAHSNTTTTTDCPPKTRVHQLCIHSELHSRRRFDCWKSWAIVSAAAAAEWRNSCAVFYYSISFFFWFFTASHGLVSYEHAWLSRLLHLKRGRDFQPHYKSTPQGVSGQKGQSSDHSHRIVNKGQKLRICPSSNGRNVFESSSKPTCNCDPYWQQLVEQRRCKPCVGKQEFNHCGEASSSESAKRTFAAGRWVYISLRPPWTSTSARRVLHVVFSDGLG